MFLNTVVQKVLTIGTFFILARLLSPEHYGIMSVVFIIAGFADRFTTHGFDSALIQRGGEVESFLDDLWTLNVAKALGLCTLIYFLGGILSAYFHVRDYAILISLSGLFVLIPNLANTRQIYFFKNLDFKKIFVRDISGYIAYTGIALWWALVISPTVWALFYAQLGRLVVTSAMTYVLYPVLPRIRFRIAKLRTLFNYSKWISGKTMVDYFLGIIDTLYVGRLLDPAALGAYSKADSLSSIVTEPVTGIITKVGFPAYARVQGELGKLQEGFLRSLDILIALAVPVSLLLLIEGGTLVLLLLGQKWLVMVIPLKILSIATLCFSIARSISPLFDSIGKPDINFKASILQLIVSPLALYYGTVQYGVRGTAYAMLFISLVVLAYMIVRGRTILRLGKESFTPLVVTVVSSVMCVTLLELIFRALFRTGLDNLVIFVWVIFLATIYILCLWWVGQFFSSGPRYTVSLIIKELKISQLLSGSRKHN